MSLSPPYQLNFKFFLKKQTKNPLLQKNVQNKENKIKPPVSPHPKKSKKDKKIDL